MKTNISVYGIFKSRLHLSEGLHQIRASGFRGEDISVLMPETDGSKDIGITNSTKSPEGVAVGGAVGAVIAAAWGWVVGWLRAWTGGTLGPLRRAAEGRPGIRGRPADAVVVAVLFHAGAAGALNDATCVPLR